MTLDTEKMADEALAMKLAITGDAHGDYFHAFNWADKPHRVVYDAVKIINAAAAELATLRAEMALYRKCLSIIADGGSSPQQIATDTLNGIDNWS